MSEVDLNQTINKLFIKHDLGLGSSIWLLKGKIEFCCVYKKDLNYTGIMK